jgi:hypothetical protein
MAYGTLTHFGAAFQPLRASCCPEPVQGYQPLLHRLATPPAQRLVAWHADGLGGSRFARHYSGTCFASSGYMRCFSSPTYLPRFGGSGPMTARGLPHSETRGSKPDCGSPGVSLLVCVLHRLVVPRHPPTAYHILPDQASPRSSVDVSSSAHTPCTASLSYRVFFPGPYQAKACEKARLAAGITASKLSQPPRTPPA